MSDSFPRRIYLLDPHQYSPETIAVTFAKTSRSPESFDKIAHEAQHEQEQVLPAGGVYACQARIGSKRYMAVTNIGLRPTFSSEHPHVTIESHLLDFSQDVYDQELHLDFIQRLRGERRFEDAADLVKQIHADITHARRLLV